MIESLLSCRLCLNITGNLFTKADMKRSVLILGRAHCYFTEIIRTDVL